LNELEFTISNLTNNIIEDLKKFDLLIYSDDVLNLKFFNVFPTKIFSLIFYSNLANSKKYSHNSEGINQILINNDGVMNEIQIKEKILSFTSNP
jgi:hypothetical protein